MRLGGYYRVETIEELTALCKKLDRSGLSAIQAPNRLEQMSDDACIEFGEEARKLNICIGETGMWQNLFCEDKALRQSRIESIRTLLQKADLMKCRTIVSLVGSRVQSDLPIAAHVDNFSAAFRSEFRDIVLRILDGLKLRFTHYSIEPWPNTFFYQPDDIAEFIASVDHPRFGLHLDQTNMVSQLNYFDTSRLINQTFDLLTDRIYSVHLKDVKWDGQYMLLKLDEVLIGDGDLDYATFLKRLNRLPADLPCFCEHLPDEKTYLENFQRLQKLADKLDIRFVSRQIT